MYITTRPVDLDARTVLEDLCIRESVVDEDAVCPFSGLSGLVAHYMEGYQGTLYALLDGVTDYDLDKQRPIEGPYMSLESRDMVDSAYDPVNNPDVSYHRRFEDIDDIWPHHYVDNILKGKKIYFNKGGVREYNRNNKEQVAIIDEEDGEVKVQSSLESIIYNYSDEQYAREHVIYLLRKLDDYGRAIGVHMFSLAVAYEKARRELRLENSQKRYQSRLSKARLLNISYVYRQKADGTLGSPFVYESCRSSKAFKDLWDWLNGVSEFGVYERQCLEDLIDECRVLGIDIRNENPVDYTHEYISSLCCTYVVSNREYLTQNRKFNFDILSELSTITLDSWYTGNLETVTNTQSDSLAITLQRWRDLEHVDDEMPPSIISIYITQISLLTKGESLDVSRTYVQDGIYFLRSGEPFYVDVYRLSGGKYRKAMVSIDGYLVAVCISDAVVVKELKVAASEALGLLGGFIPISEWIAKC